MNGPNVRLKNGVISSSHFPLTTLEKTTRILADVDSGSGTITVRNITGLAVNQVLLLGSFGDETAEIIKTHASTAPSGSTVTLASNTVYAHATDCPVTVIGYDQVEFSRSTTLTGSKSVLATSNITPDSIATGYNDLVNSTGYAFARFKNTITSVFSDYSDAVPYTGNPANSVEAIVMKAVKDCGNTLDDEFCLEADLIQDVNEAQDAVSSLRDWSYELYKDVSSIITIIGETVYDLGGLSMKYPDESQSLLSMRLGNTPLAGVSYAQIEDDQQFSKSDVLASDATIGATSITLGNSHSFQDEGNVYLRENGWVAYTANDTSTGILSGIDSSAITVLVPTGATVWQDIEVGTPTSAAVIDGAMNLDIPPDDINAGINIKFRFLRKLPTLTSFSSTTLIPFYSCLSYYVQSRIENRKRNYTERDTCLAMFTALVEKNVARWKIPTRRSYHVWNFSNTIQPVDDDEYPWWD